MSLSYILQEELSDGKGDKIIAAAASLQEITTFASNYVTNRLRSGLEKPKLTLIECNMNAGQCTMQPLSFDLTVSAVIQVRPEVANAAH